MPTVPKSNTQLPLSTLNPIKSYSGKTAGLATSSTTTKKKTTAKVIIKKVSPITPAQRRQLMSAMRTIARLGGYKVTRAKGTAALI